MKLYLKESKKKKKKRKQKIEHSVFARTGL